MQKFLNVRWITFYGVTIAFVIALFSTVTNYGEANLSAPAKIAGRYRINAKNLPGCLKAETLILSIDQSGIYLNGSLTASGDSTLINKQKRSLTGLWNQQQLTLSGSPQIQPCKQEQVKLDGTINQAQLKGRISLASIKGSTNFTAQQEK